MTVLDSRADQAVDVRNDQAVSVGAGSTVLPDQSGNVREDHRATVGEDPYPAPTTGHVGWREELADLNTLIEVAANTVDDLENVRKGNNSRILHLTTITPDKDGVLRGLRLPEDHEDVLVLKVMNDNIQQLENQAIRHLEKLMRSHPLGPWAKQQKGVGDKQIARFLATVHDPYIRQAVIYEDGTIEPERVRTLPEFRSYCGYALTPDGTALQRRKGQRITWNPESRMRLWNVAESCMKGLRKPCAQDPDRKYAVHSPECVCYPYRLVYDRARAQYVDAVHDQPCAQCGGKGNPPAPVGSPLKFGHQHFRGLRAISQQVIKDVWREARRLHLERSHG